MPPPVVAFPFVFAGDGGLEDSTEWLRQVRLFALGRSEGDKVAVFELCLAKNSPAEAWYDALDPDGTLSFKAICHAFSKAYPGVAYSPLPSWLPLERLQTCVLREEDLGRDVIVDDDPSTGVIVLPAHVAYARRVQRLAAALPSNIPQDQLVAHARHCLPPSIRSCIPKHATESWDTYVAALLRTTTYEIMRQGERLGGSGIAEERAPARDSKLYRSASHAGYPVPTTTGYYPTSDAPPAPHISLYSHQHPDSDSPPPGPPGQSIPVHISSSGSERGSPSRANNIYGPGSTHAGARQYPQQRYGEDYAPSSASSSATRVSHGSPYDRDTPSAPPMANTRSWLQTKPAGAGQERSPNSARAWQASQRS